MKRRAMLGSVGAAVAGATIPVRAADPPKAQYVSIIELLGRPAALNGQEVMTAGFLGLEADGAALYLHREDFEACVLPNSLDLALTAEQRGRWHGFDRSHVAIKGRFTLTSSSSVRVGGLEAIVTIDQVPGRGTRE